MQTNNQLDDYNGYLTHLRQKEFCWDPGWVWPLESFWSIIHKFSYFNHCTKTELKQLLGLPQKTKQIDTLNAIVEQKGIDGFDIKKLTIVLQLKGHAIGRSAIDSYLHPDEIKYFSSQYLRFCPNCIGSGYHSAIHQIKFISTCPYHKSDLVDNCPQCGGYVKLTFPDLTEPYTCSVCGFKLFNDLQQLANYQPNLATNKDIVKAHKRAAAILRLRLRQYVSLSDCFVARNQSYLSGGQADGITNLCQNSIDVFFKKFSYVKNNKKRKRNISQQAIDRLLGSEKVERALVASYRKVRKELLEITLVNHVDCVKEISKQIFWDTEQESFYGVKLCPFAHAYILWRMVFECTDNMQDLFANKTFRGHGEGDWLEFTWIGLSIVDLKFKKDFLRLYLLATYSKILGSISGKSNAANRLNRNAINKDILPIWILENRQGGVFVEHGDFEACSSLAGRIYPRHLRWSKRNAQIVASHHIGHLKEEASSLDLRRSLKR